MKKLCALLVCLALLPAALPAFAADAVTSATLDISSLPVLRPEPDTNVLVIYFSTDDTVKAAARAVAEALSADVFEIVPQTPYTAADLAYYTGCRADREQDDSASRPAVAAFPESLDRYDTVFLGYPIWHGQAPRVLYTLLEGIDLSGKTVVPFCTSASSGAGSSAKNLQALTGAAGTWLDAKRLANHSTKEEIQTWVLSLKLP